MKTVLFAMLVLLTNVSFASEWPVKADIIEAIRESLGAKDLVCTNSDSGRSFKATELHLSVLESQAYKMTINENDQPVITFVAIDGELEYFVSFTTNSSFTELEKINLATNQLSKIGVNSGTITHPHIEFKEVRRAISSIECK